MYVLDLWIRRRQVHQMVELIRYLRREIRCTAAPLHQILQSPSCPKELPLLQEMDLSEPFDLSEAYRKAKLQSESSMFFSSVEWAPAEELFLSLGQGDGLEQETLLQIGEAAFTEAERNVSTVIGKNGKPALVLGCSAGAVLVLMLL